MVAEQFSQAMEAAGICPPNAIHADGQLHRFSASGKRGDRSGWYVLHLDGIPAGVFGCWRNGLVQTWCAKADSAMTSAERAAMRQRVRDAQAQRDASLLQQQKAAQGTAAERWQAATVATEHPYLTAKGIQPYGLRMEGGNLLVPMRDAVGVLHSLQTIAPDGSKRFMAGGRVRGCYHSVGAIGPVLVVCEGMATAHSIHAATGLPVAAAFSASNLAPVAAALHVRFYEVRIVLAADDDHRTEGNPGQTAARAAALAVGGLVVAPHFPADRPRWATDFNDLFSLAGAGAVRACFAEVVEGLPHG